MNYINNTSAPATTNTDTGSNEKGIFGKLLDIAKGHLNTAQNHFQRLTAPAPKKTTPITAPTFMPITPQRTSQPSLQYMVKRGGKRSKRNMRKKHDSKKSTKRTRNSRSKKTHKSRSKKTHHKR